MNLEATRMRGRPRNRWHYKVREDGRLVGGKGWKERVHNREAWKKLLRIARNCRILHMLMELINGQYVYYIQNWPKNIQCWQFKKGWIYKHDEY
jgi:hypothetical protein